jgi:DNA end-binding protein Ku
MLYLALHIVDTKRGNFDPDKLEDQYEDALKELLRKKQHGEKIERPREPARSNVVNLMDALRESVKAESARGSERRKLPRTDHRPAAKKARAHTRRKKAG